MDITIEKTEGLSLVFASGAIDAVTCAELEEALVHLVDEGQTRIILDLEGVHYISSAGMRVILIVIQKLHGTGKFALSRLNKDVMSVIEMAGFTNIMDIYEDLESAKTALSHG